MKSQYFNCACHTNDHTIRFDLSTEDKEFPDLYLSVQLNQWHNVFKRIWLAIKYVFGYRSTYGHWDTWMLNHDDVSRLRSMLECYDKHAKAHLNPPIPKYDNRKWKPRPIRNKEG